MRSGFAHLRRREQDDSGSTYVSLADAAEALRSEESAPANELDAPVWSVLSFDKLEAGGLTYSQAADLMAELDRNRVNGLCVVTDAAASRLEE